MKKKEIAWWAFRYDSNDKNVKMFNVFNNISFLEYLFKYLKPIKSKDDLTPKEKKALTERIKSCLQATYWGRFEYESAVGNPFCDDLKSMKKIDVYWQIEPNLDIFVDYVLDNLKAVKKICKAEHDFGAKAKKKKVVANG